MSGAHGWIRSAGDAGRSSRSKRTGYDSAYHADKPARDKPRTVHVNQGGDDGLDDSQPHADTRRGKDRDFHSFRTRAGVLDGTIPEAKHRLTATAKNVVIFFVDGTISMGVWTEELFQRLPLFWDELTEIFGSDDIEVLIGLFGDAKFDQHPIQVTRFGRGQELDSLVAELNHGILGGGGDGRESPELAAYYMGSMIDFGSAHNVFAFIISDEAGASRINVSHLRENLGIELDPELELTSDVLRRLRTRMRLNVLLMDSNNYIFPPIEKWWNEMLPEGVLRLDVPQRVADVAGLAIANSLSPDIETAFLDRFATRQGGKVHEAENTRIMRDTQLQLGRRGSRLKLPDPGDGTPSPLD